jgi:hypothetical protein
MLTDAAIDRTGLKHWYTGAEKIDTTVMRPGVTLPADSTVEATLTRGDTVFRFWGVPDPEPLDSMRIGASRQDTVVFAMELPAGTLAGFDGLLGRDILSQFDLFFDLARGRLQLFQRTAGVAAGAPPPWLPAGLSRGDCVAGRTRTHMSVDTTGFGEDGRRELARNPLRRLWEQEEIQLPLVIDGKAIDAMFDSGAGSTDMNWVEARAIGFTRGAGNVHAYRSGGSRAIIRNAAKLDAADDSMFAVANVPVQLAGHAFAADTLLITDPDFADAANFQADPMINVGLHLLAGRKLFLSYSTGFVCVSR